MNQKVYLTPDTANDLMAKARLARSEYFARLAMEGVQRLQRICAKPAAEPRKLAKSAIEPLMAGHRHNRSAVNPLMMRGLSIS